MEKAAVMTLSIMIIGQVLQKVSIGEYVWRLVQQQEREAMASPYTHGPAIVEIIENNRPMWAGAVLSSRSPHLAQSPRPVRCGVYCFAHPCIYGGVTGPQAIESGPFPITFVAYTWNV
jgi:hypothetical protein